MAKKTDAADGEEAKSGGAKKIVMLVIVALIAAFAGKTFLVPKPEKSAEQLAAEQEAAEKALDATCALYNADPHAPPPTTEAAHEGEGEKKAAEEAPEEPEEEPLGPVITLDPVTLNLADDHYLKVAVALQLPHGTLLEHLEEEGFAWKAKVPDLVNDRLGALDMDDLKPTEKRQALKRELGNHICHESEAEVLTIYFTEFVMQ